MGVNVKMGDFTATLIIFIIISHNKSAVASNNELAVMFRHLILTRGTNTLGRILPLPMSYQNTLDLGFPLIGLISFNIASLRLIPICCKSSNVCTALDDHSGYFCAHHWLSVQPSRDHQIPVLEVILPLFIFLIPEKPVVFVGYLRGLR